MSAGRNRLRQAGTLVTAFTLGASLCVDMSRWCRWTFIRQECLCVDLVHLIYVLHAQYRFLSTGWNNGTSYYGTSHPSPWWVSHCSIASIDQWSHSIFSQHSLGSSRINFNDSLSSSTLTRRIVPLKVLKTTGQQYQDQTAVEAGPGIVSGVFRSHAVLYSHVV